MPKPDRGRTRTIKERAIYVYLPSQEVVKDWKNRAERAGTSISKFVFDRVEDSLKKEAGEEGYLSRLELIRRLKDQDEDLSKLRKEDRMLRMLVENLEAELKRFRAKPFVEEEFEGARVLDRELVDLLKTGRTYKDDEVLAHLNIEPSDAELVKAVGKQLEILESYGLIEFVGRGWRWRG